MTTNPNDLPGIRPEDVKQTPEQQAQIAAFLADQKREEEELGKEQPIELMESELMGVWKLLQELQYKYGNRKGSFDNLTSLRNEADEKFAALGFQVIVDWVMPGLMQLNGQNRPDGRASLTLHCRLPRVRACDVPCERRRARFASSARRMLAVRLSRALRACASRELPRSGAPPNGGRGGAAAGAAASGEEGGWAK